MSEQITKILKRRRVMRAFWKTLKTFLFATWLIALLTAGCSHSWSTSSNRPDQWVSVFFVVGSSLTMFIFFLKMNYNSDKGPRS